MIICEKPLHCMGYRCKHSLVLLNVDCSILVVLSKVLKISLYWFCVFCLAFKYFRQYFRSNHHHLVCSMQHIMCKHNSLRFNVLLVISSCVRPICKLEQHMKLDLKGHNMVSIATRIQTEWPVILWFVVRTRDFALQSVQIGPSDLQSKG